MCSSDLDNVVCVPTVVAASGRWTAGTPSSGPVPSRPDADLLFYVGGDPWAHRTRTWNEYLVEGIFLFVFLTGIFSAFLNYACI